MLTRFCPRFALLDHRVNGGNAPTPRQGTPTGDIRFDDVARTLGTTTSRRRTLAALLGGALGLHGLADAPAKKGGKKPWCHCPDGNPDNCVTLKLNKKARKKHKKNHPLDRAGECQTPEPTCPPELTICNGNCKDLQTDENNCGACSNPCGVAQTCCDGVCKNLNTDESNCGTCGNVCGAGQTCCSGVCKNLQADPANCGICGNVCAAPQVLCLAGDCCKPPTLQCVAPGADATCCTGVCLPANMAIPFHHCA